MNRRKSVFALGSLALFFSAAFLWSQAPPQKKVDQEATAQKLVNQCAAVREGELILINGGLKDTELLEDIAVNVRKAGGHPLIVIGSDRLTRRLWTDVPAKYDAQSAEPLAKLVALFSAGIYVSYNEDEGLLADIPEVRRMAVANAGAVVDEVLRKNNFRAVNLGNGMYPTIQLAQRYGLTQEELSRIFWDCINIDYSELQKTCERVKSLLAGGKEVRITNPNGTDLKVQIEGRPVFVSDGVITPDDLKKGYAACQVYLPAGEVFLAPVPGTAEGKVVFDRDFFQGQEVTGLTMVFKAGKLVSMSGKSGFVRVKAFYDAAGTGKEDFALVDIGVNPKLGQGAGNRILNYVRAGMITVGVGNNAWAGGSNNTPFSYYSYLPGSNLSVDGKALVEHGKLLQ
jgi:aminopeptidase